MEVKHADSSKNGVFYIEDNGKQIASLNYVFAGETKLIIDHTIVDKTYEGKGLGRFLVKTVVDYAREHKIKILPLCPYAKAVFDKTEEYRDVLF